MPNPFILWNAFFQKDELSSTFQVPYSQLSYALWICSKASFAAGTVDNSILEEEWEKDGYMYWILWTLFSSLRRKKMWEN